MKDFFESPAFVIPVIFSVMIVGMTGMFYLFEEQQHKNFMETKQQVIECRVKVSKDLISEIDKICGSLPPYPDNK